MEELAGRKVLVLGLGMSGRSAAAFCAAQGAAVVAADERPREALAPLDDLAARVTVVCGGRFPDPADFDLVVPSPGVPPARYAERTRRAWGDVELAWRALSVPVVAITGTNGKSTVTRMLEAMLQAAGLRAEAAGNVGRPALELVGRPLDAAVLEVSSFQLESTEAFRPRVAVILNVTPDHLDRHGSFAAYLEAKARILAQQEAEDAAVLSRDDPPTWSLAPRVRGRLYQVSARGPVTRGVHVDAGALVLQDGGAPRVLSLDGVALAGCDLENAAAALAAAWAMGADPGRALAALPRFAALPHRCEVVGEVGGVAYVNDSKATNPGAALRALERFPQPIVWLAGGRDKGLDFEPLGAAARGRVRAAILFGESAAALERILAGVAPAERSADLESAVRRAAALARPGDVVLLSPACASYDQFRSYEERGERFRAAVRELAAREGRP
jgi:UDP-N-acetylmuramoylalanine--D-glutamate ligase